MIVQVASRRSPGSSADYNGWISEVQAASIEERQLVLDHIALLDLIMYRWYNTKGSETVASGPGAIPTTITAALLEGNFKWRASGPEFTDKGGKRQGDYRVKKTTQFGAWIRGGKEAEGRPSKSDTMNCWEGTLFAAYLAGMVTYPWLKHLHGKRYEDKSPQLQSEQDYFHWLGAYFFQEGEGVTEFSEWSGEGIPAGHMVYFTPHEASASTVLDHVAISLGQGTGPDSRIMSLWNKPGDLGFQRVTLRQLRLASPTVSMRVYTGPSPW
jgi:hypothetical protein